MNTPTGSQYTGLQPASQEVLARFAVRKTKAQKQAFRDELCATLKAAGWPVRVESNGRWLKSHNVVAGNADAARLILGAHYDTPARLPIPNFLAPRNLVVTIGYQLLIAVIFFAVAFGSMALLLALGLGFRLAMLGMMLVLVVLLVLMLAGPANPSNANDNTSGTLTLLETALALPEEARQQVALVFFDNEELGLVGSGVFRQQHPAAQQALLLNFDCVGVGDTMLFVLPRAVRRDDALCARLSAAFPPAGGVQPLLDTSPLTLYPSDQMHFKKGIGVAAMKKRRGIGYYVNRVHTTRDTLLQECNLLYLRDGCLRLAQSLAAEAATDN